MDWQRVVDDLIAAKDNLTKEQESPYASRDVKVIYSTAAIVLGNLALALRKGLQP